MEQTPIALLDTDSLREELAHTLDKMTITNQHFALIDLAVDAREIYAELKKRSKELTYSKSESD